MSASLNEILPAEGQPAKTQHVDAKTEKQSAVWASAGNTKERLIAFLDHCEIPHGEAQKFSGSDRVILETVDEKGNHSSFCPNGNADFRKHNSESGPSTEVCFCSEEGKFGFKCSHSACSQVSWPEFRAYWDLQNRLAGRGEFFREKKFNDAPRGEFRNTDGGNAERLVALHGSNFRYLHKEQLWLHYDGTRWKRDASAEIHRAAKATVLAMYDEASKIENEEARKSFAQWVRRSDSRALRESMVALARNEEAVSAAAEEFDRNNFLLNLRNGTYNLQVGQFYSPRRENLITKLCPVAYDQTATCPRFLTFLAETFFDQPDVIPFLQRSFGYSLSGSIEEQCFWLLIGEGRNGKSVLLSILEYILGDYAVTAPFDIFMVRRSDGGISPRDGMASLVGTRFVRASESEQERRFSESTIKNITGGEKIRTAKMYAEDFEYLPTFKVWLSTNHEPAIRGTDDGIWRRIRRINFNQQVPPEKVDPELIEKLKAEASGILNWALEGYREYQKHGLLGITQEQVYSCGLMV